MMMGFELLLLVGVIAVVVWGVRSGWTPAGGGDRSGGNTALDILEGRFARGEIELEEFQERRTILEVGPSERG